MPQYSARVVTSDYQIANTDDMILLDVTNGNVTVFLPASPTRGQSHILAHHQGDPAAFTALINKNASSSVQIMGGDNLQLSVNQASVTLTYIDPQVGWKITSAYRAG